MMASNNTVISELGARRRMLELPASEVAARFSIEETLLCAWERGERSPSLDALQQWAAALDLKLSLVPSAAEPRRGIRADWDKHRIMVGGTPVRLTPMEWRVLVRLAGMPGALGTP